MVLPPDPTGADLGAFDEAAVDARRLAPHLWDPVAAGTLAVSRPAPGERVLDACCGTGPSAVPAALTVGPTGLVDAVDVSSAAAAVAARTARTLPGGLPHLRVHVADVTTWPGRDYDLVQCVLGVFFLPDPEGGTEHIVSRARPDGRVAVTVWRRAALQTAGAALVAAVQDERGHPAPAPAARRLVEQIGDPDALAGWLTDRGLVGVTVTEVLLAFPDEPGPLWLLVLGSGFRGLLAGLDAGAVERVRTGYLARLVGRGASDASALVGVGTRPAP